MTTQEINKAASYLKVAGVLTKHDERTLAVAIKNTKLGQPMSESVRKNTEDLVFLYKGMTK